MADDLSVIPVLDRGFFISFEGIDGAGKSTHLPALAQQLRAQGLRVVLTREPGGTALAERLRELLLHEGMDALTEALLLFAGRRDHLVRFIEPALARGEVVLCDRFTDATFAYQGGGHGFDWALLQTLERLVQALPPMPEDARGPGGGAPLPVAAGQSRLRQPDLTLWFDLPPAVAAQRLASVRTPDRFEAQPQAFFERVRQGYARRAAEAPERFVRIDAQQPPEAVGQAVEEAVHAALRRHMALRGQA